MKDKKTLLFLVIVALLVAGAFLVYTFNSNSQNKTATAQASVSATDQTLAQNSASASATATATADWHLYENTDYGFSLTFSDAWKNYQVARGTDTGGISLARLDFSLKTSDKKFTATNGNATAISIFVTNRSVWDELQPNSVNWIKLGETDKYVYAYTTWNSAPSDLLEITDKEIANVLKTFKIGA